MYDIQYIIYDIYIQSLFIYRRKVDQRDARRHFFLPHSPGSRAQEGKTSRLNVMLLSGASWTLNDSACVTAFCLHPSSDRHLVNPSSAGTGGQGPRHAEGAVPVLNPSAARGSWPLPFESWRSGSSGTEWAWPPRPAGLPPSGARPPAPRPASEPFRGARVRQPRPWALLPGSSLRRPLVSQGPLWREGLSPQTKWLLGNVVLPQGSWRAWSAEVLERLLIWEM